MNCTLSLGSTPGHTGALSRTQGPCGPPTPLPSKDLGSQSPALSQAAAPAARTLDLRLQLSPSLRSPDASGHSLPSAQPSVLLRVSGSFSPPDHRPLQPVARGSLAHLHLCLRQLRSLPLAPAAPALHAARGQPVSPSLGRSPWCQTPSPAGLAPCSGSFFALTMLLISRVRGPRAAHTPSRPPSTQDRCRGLEPGHGGVGGGGT